MPAHRAWAVIYRYMDQNGVIHFSDTPSPGAARMKAHYRPIAVRIRRRKFRPPARMAKRMPGYGGPLKSPRLSDTRMEGLIEKDSKKYGLDPSLVRAVIQTESGFDCTAVSPKGAMGLMQLMPTTAARLGVYNPFDPADNIKGGVRYLSRMLARFGGNLPLALAAYNAGPQSIEQWGSIPPYPETRSYVRKVLHSYGMGSLSGLQLAGGAWRGGRKQIQRQKRATVIYRVKLPDGGVLYTNDPPGF